MYVLVSLFVDSKSTSSRHCKLLAGNGDTKQKQQGEK